MLFFPLEYKKYRGVPKLQNSQKLPVFSFKIEIHLNLLIFRIVQKYILEVYKVPNGTLFHMHNYLDKCHHLQIMYTPKNKLICSKLKSANQSLKNPQIILDVLFWLLSKNITLSSDKKLNCLSILDDFS